MAVGMISNSTATVVANSSTGWSKSWCSKGHSWTQPEAYTLLTLPRGFRHSPFHVFNPFPFKIPSYFPFLVQNLADSFSFALHTPSIQPPSKYAQGGDSPFQARMALLPPAAEAWFRTLFSFSLSLSDFCEVICAYCSQIKMYCLMDELASFVSQNPVQFQGASDN